MSKQIRYSPEVKERAVRMLLEHQDEYSTVTPVSPTLPAAVPARSKLAEPPPNQRTQLLIKDLLRHQAISTTERYIQRLEGNLKDTVNLLRTDENLLPDLLPDKKEGPA